MNQGRFTTNQLVFIKQNAPKMLNMNENFSSDNKQTQKMPVDIGNAGMQDYGRGFGYCCAY